MNKDASEKMETTVCTAQCFSVVFLIYLSITFIDKDFQKKPEQEKKKEKIAQVFGHVLKEIQSFFQKAFLHFAYFMVDIHAMPC